MKLTNPGLKRLLEKPGRHGDGAGLFFRTLGGDKAYWVYRYRVGRREREFSIGPFNSITVEQMGETAEKADVLDDEKVAGDFAI